MQTRKTISDLREKWRESEERRRKARLEKLAKQRDKDIRATERAIELAEAREQAREAARKRVEAQERAKAAGPKSRFSGVSKRARELVKEGEKLIQGKSEKKATRKRAARRTTKRKIVRRAR